MTNARFHALFGDRRGSRRAVTQREMDLARSIQVVIEEVVLRLATPCTIRQMRSPVSGRGVALNCVANAGYCERARSRDCGSSRPPGMAGGAVAPRSPPGTSTWIVRTPNGADLSRGAIWDRASR